MNLLLPQAVMIPLDEAQRFVLGLCAPLPPVELPLDDALGCVLSARGHRHRRGSLVRQLVNGRLRGAGRRHRGAPVRLTVIGSIMAGHPLDRDGRPGPGGTHHDRRTRCHPEQTQSAWSKRPKRLPMGAASSSDVELQPGDFVRQPGRDVAIGDVIAPAGTVLTPAHLGVLANQGALQREGPSPSAGRGALHRRRALLGDGSAPPRQDPRRQPPHPAGPRPPRGVGRHRPRDRRGR